MTKAWRGRLGVRLAGVLAVVGLLGAGVAMWWLRGGLEAPAARMPSTARTWPVGESRHFSVELETWVRSDAPLFQASVRGRWHLTRLADESAGDKPAASGHSGIRLHAVFEPDEVKVDVTPDSSSALSSVLSTEAVLIYARNGALIAVKLPAASEEKAVEHIGRGLIASLASMAQLSEPGQDPNLPWKAHERDFTGTYEAKYRSCGVGCVEKRKARYLSSSAPALLEARTLVDQSLSRYQTNGAISLAGLSSAEGREKTHVESDGPMPKLASETRFSLRQIGGATKNQAVTSMRLADPVAVVDALHPVPTEGTVKPAPTTTVPFDVALTALDALRASKGAEAKEARAYAEFVRQLRANDADVGKALERILRGEDRGLLIDALSNAGSPAAQAALRSTLAQANLSEQDRYNVAMALSLVPRPDEQTVAFLEELTNDKSLHQQALYGLGAGARRLRAAEPARAEAITKDLGARLDATSDPHEQQTVLRALGNSGNPHALAQLVERTRSEDPALRAAAYDAMRLIPGSEVDALLGRALVEDLSPEVRQACSQAVRHREPSPSLVYALRAAVLGDPNERARSQAVRTALRFMAYAEPLRETLANVAQADTSEEIRKMATPALTLAVAREEQGG